MHSYFHLHYTSLVGKEVQLSCVYPLIAHKTIRIKANKQANQSPSGPSNLNPDESSFSVFTLYLALCPVSSEKASQGVHGPSSPSIYNSHVAGFCHFLSFHLLRMLWPSESAVFIPQMPSAHQPKVYWNSGLWEGHAVETPALPSHCQGLVAAQQEHIILPPPVLRLYRMPV